MGDAPGRVLPVGAEHFADSTGESEVSQVSAAPALHLSEIDPQVASLLAGLDKLSPEQRQAIVDALSRDAAEVRRPQ
jgi:hypothetical protein